MKEYFRIQKTMRGKSFPVFMAGVALGIVFFFLWKKMILVNSAKLLGELLTWKQYTEIERPAYFLYILQHRAKNVILFLLFTGIWNRQIASKLFLLGMGMQLGLLACIGMALYGVLGILFTMCVYFPQGICYLLAVLVIGRPCETTGGIQSRRAQWYTIISCSVFTIIGILFEVYVNLKIFFKFLRILKNL